jgi:Fic family protein
MAAKKTKKAHKKPSKAAKKVRPKAGAAKTRGAPSRPVPKKAKVASKKGASAKKAPAKSERAKPAKARAAQQAPKAARAGEAKAKMRVDDPVSKTLNGSPKGRNSSIKREKVAPPVGDAALPRPPSSGQERRKGAPKAASVAPPRSVPPLREPPRIVTLPLPLLPPPKRASIEERSAIIEERLAAQSEDFRQRYIDSFDMSWIYHDSALEGVVYTFEELRTALAGQAQPVTDSSLQPTYDDIRRHKEAIEFVRDFGQKKRLPVTLDVVKKVYLILHPEEGDVKTVKYRKDIPQHRLYFHEYAPPDKIAYKVRQIVDWLNDPETRKTRNGVRIAARAHYDLVRVYPFATDSGKVARLFMNLLLMRTGLPPSIIHSTERQRYYEALKGSATTVLQMVQEAVENALSSVEKLLDEHETKKRAFVS